MLRLIAVVFLVLLVASMIVAPALAQDEGVFFKANYAFAFYENPDASSGVLGTVPANTVLEKVVTVDGFVFLRWDGGEGWTRNLARRFEVYEIDNANAVVNWEITGVPDSVLPLKFANKEADEKSCDIPGACWILDPEGVLSAARYEDAEANPSAVWSGGGDAEVYFENDTATISVPVGGYALVVGEEFDFSCDSGQSGFMQAGAEGASFLLIRGRNEGSAVLCNFTNYTDSAVMAQIFAVPIYAGAFFSQAFLDDQVLNSFEWKNCGEGCDHALLLSFDSNDGAYSVLTRVVEHDWVAVDTNTRHR